MKDSIRQSKDVKSKMNAHQQMAVVSEENAMLFQVETTLKVIAEIRGELDGLIKTARDDQLIARKDNQKSIIQS